MHVSFSSEVDDHTPNHDDLMNDVAAVIPATWRLVGVQLKLPNGTLDEIQAQNAGKPYECKHSFEQVFVKWGSLGTSPYTWKTMINALRSPAVGEVTLANELSTKMHVSIAHASCCWTNDVCIRSLRRYKIRSLRRYKISGSVV